MNKNPIREHLKGQIGKAVAQMPPGFSSWLQPKIVAVLPDSITMDVKVRPEMCNPIGTLHGGMHAAILDELMGMTVAAMGNSSHFVSLNMTTDFLRVARAGQTVRATCRIVKAGRRTIHLVGSITDLEELELSRATVNMISTGKPLTL